MFYIFFITLWFAVCVFHYSISFSLPDSLLPCYLPHTLPHPTAVGNSAIYSNGWRPRCVLIDYPACPSRRSAVLLRLPPLLPLFTPFTPTPIQTQSEALASPASEPAALLTTDVRSWENSPEQSRWIAGWIANVKQLQAAWTISCLTDRIALQLVSSTVLC